MSSNEIARNIALLSLPRTSFDGLSYCSASSEDFGAFLKDLPHTNPAELCSKLYALLPELAGLNVPPGRKMALLDLARPEAFACVQRLTRNLTINQTTAKMLSLSIAMLRHLAEGYKSVLVKTLESPAAPPHLAVSAGYSALAVLSQILMECWESYVPPPANTWLEIHAIYNIARFKGLDTLPYQESRVTSGARATIKSAYVVPLMIASADPGRYTPQDLRRIETFLLGNGDLVDFAQNHLEGIFVVDTQSDKGPQYSFKVDGTTNRHFRLRTFRLVKHIEERLASGTLSGLNDRLARELCKYWSREIKREDEHLTDSTRVHIVFGLSHIHRHLTQTKNLETYLKNLSLSKPKAHLSLTLMEDKPADHRDVFLGRQGKPSPLAPATPGQPLEDEKSTLRIYEGIRSNISAGGARVEFDAPGENLTAGELVYIQPLEGSQPQLGLVRWTRVTSALKRMVGVQFIADRPEPCAVSQLAPGTPQASVGGAEFPFHDSEHPSAGGEQYYPGMLLSLDADAHLVVTALPFRPYSSVMVHSAAGKKVTRLLSCRDATFHVSIFKLDSTSLK